MHNYGRNFKRSDFLPTSFKEKQMPIIIRCEIDLNRLNGLFFKSKDIVVTESEDLRDVPLELHQIIHIFYFPFYSFNVDET